MKNPFLSLWLSAINSGAGAARGMATAEMQRQQAAMWQEWTRQSLDFWSGAWFVRTMQASGKRRPPSR